MGEYRVAKQAPAKVKVRPAGYSPAIRRLDVKDKDPNFHYHLARNDQARIDYLTEALGYEVVLASQDKAKAPDQSQPDSRRVVAGRYILLRCSLEEYEERVRMRSADAEEATIAPRESFKTKAAQAGVESIDKSKKTRAPLSSIPDDESKLED